MNIFMDLVLRIKMVLASLKTSILQLFSTSNQQLPTHHQQEPPSSPDAQPKPPLPHNNLQWQNIIMAFCFTSALEISLQYVQNQFHLPSSFHLLSLLIMLTFALLFVAKFISLKFPVASQVLEKLVVLMAVTTVFYTIAIPFPLSLKCATWAVYVASMLTVVILNSF
ncbi:hypothetical protein Pint_25881 [Pistacia integerrima]|uniref:Uncharacterized protein n=1 Tax=Pistacia integerrima TaxID=434235 RepID=A0ACC0YEJ5_9ROSI|nr:hypothetical protein Pint_25881 [Pistacia integerrima]